MTQIHGNHEVEAAAIEWVLDYERSRGREARDSRHHGEVADITSSERVIEVKAYGGSARGNDLWLEVRQHEEAKRNPNFHLYLVENVRQGDPAKFRLLDLHGAQLAQLVGRARERRYFTVPFPVAVYDRLAATD